MPCPIEVPLCGASRAIGSSSSFRFDDAFEQYRLEKREAGNLVTSMTLGVPDDTAAISCAGTVLSQPPISTTASIGWARIISSVSIAIRLRRYMLVGAAKLSCSEMVGNSIGSAPSSITPRFTASISSARPIGASEALSLVLNSSIIRVSTTSGVVNMWHWPHDRC